MASQLPAESIHAFVTRRRTSAPPHPPGTYVVATVHREANGRPERLRRIEVAIAFATECKPEVTRSDAADWAERRLAAPREAGVVRVLYHSIVWQYVSPAGRARIERAMEQVVKNGLPKWPAAPVQQAPANP